MRLTKEHVNKLVNIENCPVIQVEENEFSEGDVLILFNNSEKHTTIQSNLPNSYKAGFAKTRNYIEFPPRSLINAVFVNKDTVVFSGGM